MEWRELTGNTHKISGHSSAVNIKDYFYCNTLLLSQVERKSVHPSAPQDTNTLTLGLVCAPLCCAAWRIDTVHCRRSLRRWDQCAVLLTDWQWNCLSVSITSRRLLNSDRATIALLIRTGASHIYGRSKDRSAALICGAVFTARLVWLVLLLAADKPSVQTGTRRETTVKYITNVWMFNRFIQLQRNAHKVSYYCYALKMTSLRVTSAAVLKNFYTPSHRI